MKKLFSKIIMFLSVWILVLISFDLSKIVKNGNCDIKAYWIQNIVGKTYDIAFVGDSRVLYMCDPVFFEGKLDKKVINLGNYGTGYDGMYIILNDFLKNNDLDMVFLQVDFASLNSKKYFGDSLRLYEYLPIIYNDSYSEILKSKVSFLKYYFFKALPNSIYVEFLPEVLINKRVLSYVLNNKFCKSEVFDKYGGFDPFAYGDREFDIGSKVVDSFTSNDYDLFYLHKLVEFCLKKNIEVVLFTPPYSDKFYSNIADKKIFYGLVDDFVSRYNLKYYDFNSIVSLRENTLFADSTHMNRFGVKSFSESLGQVFDGSYQ